MLTVDGIEFSDWLNDQMNARGWRAVDLANAANLPSATVVRILNGDRNAGPDAAVKIAKARPRFGSQVKGQPHHGGRGPRAAGEEKNQTRLHPGSLAEVCTGEV